MPKIHQTKSNDQFYKDLVVRADARRKRNRSEGPSGKRRFDPDYSNNAMICYAYSISTKEYYVGYSGTAGGMFGGKKGGALYTADKTAQSGSLNYRAYNRFIRVGKELAKSFNLDHQELTAELMSGSSQFDNQNERRKFPACNCAEASALAIAASYKSGVLPHLVFTTFHSKKGVYAPCENCIVWIKKSFAYHDGDKYVFN